MELFLTPAFWFFLGLFVNIDVCVALFIIYVNRSESRDHYCSTVAAYYQFLTAASEWLSRRVTDVCIFVVGSY